MLSSLFIPSLVMITRALQLPSDVWQEFILPCFSVETLGIFDTALAYSSEHNVLLQHQSNWIWKPERHIYLNEQSLKWIRRRKINVTRCVVDPHSIAEIGPAAFMLLCDVKSLQVANFTDATLLDQILGCIECIQELKLSYNDTTLFEAEDKVAECLRLCGEMTTSFSGDRCPAVDDRTLHHLMQYCPHLSSFSLGCGSYCSSVQIADFLRQMSGLRILELCDVTNDLVRSAHSDYKTLTSLSLTQSRRITEEALATIVRQCDQLTILDVSGTRFSDSALCALAESCPQLTELHLDACSFSDSSLQYFFAARTCLTKLTLMLNSKQSRVFTALAGSWRAMRELRVTSLQLSQHQLSTIAHNSTHLHKLDVMCDSFFACHALRKLRLLTDVTLMGNTNDSTVLVLVESCLMLKRLDISGCVNITDVSLRDIARHCAELRELRCGGCHFPCQPNSYITNAWLLHVAANCAQLRRLVVVHCLQVTEAVMYTLRDCYPRIQVDWYRPAHILLVDDCLSLLKIKAMLLKRAGHTTEGACDGKEGLQKLITSNESDRQKFDFVVMDIQMPVMDGFEATLRFREYERDRAQRTGHSSYLPIIGTSALSASEVRSMAIEVGMNGYVEAPVTFPLLCEEFATIPRHLRPINLVL